MLGIVDKSVRVAAGTNLFDASETAAAIAEDAAGLPPVRAATPGGAGLRQALRARGVQVPSMLPSICVLEFS